ncbi:MAG: hypothetical protein Q8736_02815, partial [Sweet potato little leaf phytoplasma]|nr:hypothetical protein [Sweet potato little leaf phytoplasma]
IHPAVKIFVFICWLKIILGLSFTSDFIHNDWFILFPRVTNLLLPLDFKMINVIIIVMCLTLSIILFNI